MVEKRVRMYTIKGGLYLFWVPDTRQLGVADFNGRGWSKVMTKEERIALLGGSVSAPLLEERWNDVFDEKGFVGEVREGGDSAAIRFGTKLTVELEKIPNPMTIISAVLDVLLETYEQTTRKRRPVTSSTGSRSKKARKDKKPLPLTKLVKSSEVSVLNKNLKRRAGPCKGPVFEDDDE